MFQLLEDVMSLLDSLAVWDVPSGAGWQEMVHLGLSVIVAFAQNNQLEVSILVYKAISDSLKQCHIMYGLV